MLVSGCFRKVIVLLLLQLSTAYISVTPIYSADPNFQAGSGSLLASTTSAPFSNSYSVPYAHITVTNPPAATFGLKTYEGNDYLVQEFFNLSMPSLTNTQATFLINLWPITTVVLLEVNYLLLQTSVNYNMHLFQGFDLNFSSPLTNVTTMSASLTSHTEVIDYAGNQVYNSPYLDYQTLEPVASNNRMFFFLTALSVVSTSGVPLQMNLDYAILNTTHYSLTLTIGYNVSLTRFCFSQIVYNSSAYTAPNPRVIALDWLLTDAQSSSNTYRVYSTIIGNQFLVGLKTFNVSNAQNTLTFRTDYGIYSGHYGIQVVPSVPSNASLAGLNSCVVSIFYLQDRVCPGGYPYYNSSADMCQDGCPTGYYANVTDSTCYPCPNSLCLTCDPTAPSTCLSCFTNYQLVSPNCLCDTSLTTKFLVDTTTCMTCGQVLAHCTTCDYSANASLPLNTAQFVCIGCDTANGYFIDPNDQCSTCSIPHCLTCVSLAQCSLCATGYGVTPTGACSTCPLTACATCFNASYCAACSANYSLISGACYTCSQSCNCNGYTLPRKENGDCSGICGDGIIIFPYEECDDNNSLSGDGCSRDCTVEADSTCGGTPSSCFLKRNIAVLLLNTSVHHCNQLTFRFQVIPALLLFDQYPVNWTAFLTTSHPALALLAPPTYQAGVLTISYSFSATLQRQLVTFQVNPVGIVTSSYLSTVSPSELTVEVRPCNNLAAVYSSQAICRVRASTQSFMGFQSAFAYVGLACSLLSLKIAGLQMFGVLQLSFLVLSDYDYVNPLLVGALDRKEVNGLNLSPSRSPSPLNARLQLNGFTSELFLHNYNLMLYLTLALALVGTAAYAATYLILRLAPPTPPPALQQNHQNDSEDSEGSEEEEKQDKEWDKQQEAEEGKAAGEEGGKVAWVHRCAKYMLKEGLTTLLLFNMLNMSFSAGLQMLYIGEVDSWSILAMLVSLTLPLLAVGAQLVTDHLQFGEFKDKFKKHSPACHHYASVSLLYRFLLGLLLALLNEWPQGSLVLLGVSGCFVGYLFVTEPFEEPWQNHRSKAVHCVHVLILLVNYYYRMMTEEDEVSANGFLFPAYLQLIAVGVCTIVCSVLLGYQGVVAVKGWFCRGQAGRRPEGLAQGGDLQKQLSEKGENI